MTEYELNENYLLYDINNNIKIVNYYYLSQRL